MRGLSEDEGDINPEEMGNAQISPQQIGMKLLY